MNYVNFFLNEIDNNYSCENPSNIEMSILGEFLARDIYRPSSFRDWFFDANSNYASGNLTTLKKESGYIFLGDAHSEEENPTELKMTYSQFLQLLNEWEEKVMKQSPKEVTLKYENDEFIFEAKD